MTLLDDDIIEYSKSIEKLQRENTALKFLLRRYDLFGDNDPLANLTDCDVTAQVREAETIASVMFDTLQVPAFAGDLIADEKGVAVDFMFTRVNARFAGFFHLSPKDIIGKTNSSLSLLKSTLWLDTIAIAAKTLEPKETKIMEGNNAFDVTAFSVKHTSFIAHFVMSSVAAYTDNASLLNNLPFTQLIVDAIPVPLFYKSMDGKFILCNKAYAKTIIGMPPEAIAGKSVTQFANVFSKDYVEVSHEIDSRLVSENDIQTHEGLFKCADGIEREYIVNKTLIKGSDGKSLGILGVMQDIAHTLKTQRELAESEIRYRTLFNSMLQPIIIVDIEGNIILLNTSAVELFEEDDSHLMVGEQDVPALKLVNMEFVRHVYENGEPITRRVQLTVKGQERWYMSHMQVINDLFGEKVVQIISNDITEIKRYQSELIEEKQRAEESNNLKTVFLTNIAHETRTPANLICGLAQMLKSGINAEKHSEYLDAIYSNCKKLLAIIDDIVELSKIETAQIKIRHEICSINNIVEEAYVNLNDVLAETGKNISISHSPLIDEYKSLIYADNQYISQVLRKLIDNAVTFTQKGSIEVGARIEDATVTFYVKDTGIGIPSEKLGTIFERFRQADEGVSRQYGGNGLGLSIANELVRSMNGTMKVESTENEGSTFSFTIQYERAGV